LIPESKAETHPWGHYQSSNPENVVDLVDINGNPINAPVVNHVPIVNGEIPTANNARDVDLSDDDAGLQETLRIFESIVEYNKRERASLKRKREEEFENVDIDVLNAIINVCSMPMDYE